MPNVALQREKEKEVGRSWEALLVDMSIFFQNCSLKKKKKEEIIRTKFKRVVIGSVVEHRE